MGGEGSGDGTPYAPVPPSAPGPEPGPGLAAAAQKQPCPGAWVSPQTPAVGGADPRQVGPFGQYLGQQAELEESQPRGSPCQVLWPQEVTP